MQRIFNLFKWFGRLLLAGVLILIITFVIFLNKPSLFIDDIEEIISARINQKLNSNIKINISSIDGDFVSGFYVKNTQVFLNEDLAASMDSIYINPNISDLLLLNISFSNISLITPKIYHDNLPQINFEDYSKKRFKIDFASQIPFDIIIDQFFIDNGIYRLANEEFLFNGKLKCLYSEMLNIDIESFNILLDKRKIFNINKGSFLLSKDNFTLILPDYQILKNNGQGNFNYDIANEQVSVVDFSFKHFTLPKYGKVEDIIINLSQANSSMLTLNNSLSYNSNTFKSIITLNFNEVHNKLLSARITSIPKSDAEYDLDIISTSKDGPEFSIQLNKFNYNSLIVDDLKLQCRLKKNFSGVCEVGLLGSIISPFIEVDNLSGIFEVDEKKYILKEVIFESDAGNGKIIYGQHSPEFQTLNCKLDIINVSKLTELFNSLPIIEGGPLQAKINYYANIDSSSTQVNIQSNSLKIDNFSIGGSHIKLTKINKNLEYEANFYQPKILELKLDTLQLSGTGEKNSYFNYMRGYNISTGENIESSFIFTNDSTLSIEFVKGKLKDVPFHSKDITFNQNEGIITSSPLTINFGVGTLYSQIKFLDSKNYLLNLRASQINLLELKKIFQFNNRINGEMNGEIYLSCENSQPTVLTNLNFRDGNIDDILFENFDVQASFRDDRLTLSEVDINTDIGQLKLSGWLTNTGEKLTFTEADLLNISGDFDKFEISYLMRYFPWEQNTTGLLSGKININGNASSPRIELESTITNPSFDKIIAEKISGNLIYKNERLYLKAMNIETSSGTYTGTGSIPANLSFVKIIDLNLLEQPLDFIFTGKSNSFEFLTPYIDEIESLNGEFTMQLGLSGTLKHPIRGGQISIQNATLELFQLDNSIESLSGIATIASNKLIIKKLSGRLVESESDIDLFPSVIIAAKKIFSDKKDNDTNNNVTVNGSIDLTEFFNPNYTLSIDDEIGSWTKTDANLTKWNNSQRQIKKLNLENEFNNFMIPSEELSLHNLDGYNIHALILNNKAFLPGQGDGGEIPFDFSCDYNTLTLGDVLEDNALCIAAHPCTPVPFLQKLFFKRGEWNFEDLILEHISGLQLFNGEIDNSLFEGLKMWKKLLLSGYKKFIYAGNDAHGNFNKYRQIKIPMISIHEKDSQILGECRTGVIIEDNANKLTSSISALKHGRCFITNGPQFLIKAIADVNHGMGDCLVANFIKIKIEFLSTEEIGNRGTIKVYSGIINEHDEQLISEINISKNIFTEHIEISINKYMYVRAEFEGNSYRGKRIALTNPIWIKPTK